METIKHLQRAEFESVMHNGRDMILFFYKKMDPASILGINTIEEVNDLIGRGFDLYLVDVDNESDIANAFSVETIPEYVSMKNCKIFKRSTDLLQPSGVLAMLK